MTSRESSGVESVAAAARRLDENRVAAAEGAVYELLSLAFRGERMEPEFYKRNRATIAAALGDIRESGYGVAATKAVRPLAERITGGAIPERSEPGIRVISEQGFDVVLDEMLNTLDAAVRSNRRGCIKAALKFVAVALATTGFCASGNVFACAGGIAGSTAAGIDGLEQCGLLATT